MDTIITVIEENSEAKEAGNNSFGTLSSRIALCVLWALFLTFVPPGESSNKWLVLYVDVKLFMPSFCFVMCFVHCWTMPFFHKGSTLLPSLCYRKSQISFSAYQDWAICVSSLKTVNTLFLPQEFFICWDAKDHAARILQSISDSSTTGSSWKMLPSGLVRLLFFDCSCIGRREVLVSPTWGTQ